MSGQPTQNQGFQPVGLWSNIFPGYYNSNQQPAGSLNPQQQLALQLQLQAQAHTAQVRVTPDTRDCVWRCSPVASSQPFLVHKAPDSARANRLVSTVSKGRMWYHLDERPFRPFKLPARNSLAAHMRAV